MAESELERAFQSLAEALTITEAEILEEIQVIQAQIDELKDRIINLNTKQESLSHDKESLTQMFSRYCATEDGAS